MFIRSKLDETLHPWLYHRAPDDDSGAGADPGGDPDDGDGDEGEEGDGDSGKTFTERDMQRIRLKETRKAEAAARRKLLEDLGVTDPAEAKKIIETAKKAAEKDRTELDKARDRAQTAEQERQQAIRDAATARLDRDIDRALASAGVQPKRLDRIAKLVVAELGDEPDADDIRQAIETIRDDFPESFAPTGDGGGDGRRAPSGEGRGGKPPKGQRGGNTEDPLTRGAERARAMQGRKTVNA